MFKIFKFYSGQNLYQSAVCNRGLPCHGQPFITETQPTTTQTVTTVGAELWWTQQESKLPLVL